MKAGHTAMGAGRRRDFLRIGLGAGALTTAAGLLPWSSISALAREMENFIKGPPVPDIAPTRLSDRVWMIYSPDGFPTPENLGMMCNVTFVLSSQGVVILDSGASLQIGEMAIRQIRKLTDKPVIAIFNSHYHGDHWLGNQAYVEAFGNDMPIYAHPESKARIEGFEGNSWRTLMEKWTNQSTVGTMIVPPNRTVQHGAEFSFGDTTLRVHHYGVAHTPGDICVEVVEDRLTHVGDVAMDRRIANMDDGKYLGTFAFYDALEKNASSTVWVPGHGHPGGDVLRWNRELFEGIYRNCEAAFKAGKGMAAAREMVLADPRVASRAADTKGFDNNIGKYVSLAYLEAEENNF